MKKIDLTECKIKFPISVAFNRHIVIINNPRETLYPRDSYSERANYDLPSYKFQVKIINTKKNSLLNIPMFSGYPLWNIGISEIDEDMLFEVLQNVLIHSCDDSGNPRRYLVTNTTKNKIRDFFGNTDTTSNFINNLNTFIKERNKIR